MFKFPFVIFMLIFSLLSGNSVALEVNDLYQVNIVVDSQDSELREQAIKKALQGVFLKVGGKKSVLTHKVLRQAQKRASRYVSQYRYQRKDEQLSLVVSFNENKVNQLFKKANLALWGSLRPQVLLWLIDEQGTSRNMIAADAESIIPASVNDFSIERGLPIIMPLMDLTDNENVVLSDFWGYFPEQIQQASLRYFADTVVVMKVSDSSLVMDTEQSETTGDLDNISCGLLCVEQKVESPKVLEWRIYTQGTLYVQKYQGVDKVSLINQGLSDITEFIYQSYALLASAENEVVIEVQNVTSLTSDSQVFNFLTDLSSVKTVTLISAQSSVRRFQLDLVGSQTSFLASLKLNTKLTQKFDSQFDDLPVIDEIDEQHDVDSNFERDILSDLRTPMKIVVLGEDNAVKHNLEDNVQDNAQSSAQYNNQETIDKSLSASNLPSEEDNAIDAKPGTELSTSEQDSAIKALTPPLTIIPNIPVFYWEQG